VHNSVHLFYLNFQIIEYKLYAEGVRIPLSPLVNFINRCNIDYCSGFVYTQAYTHFPIKSIAPLRTPSRCWNRLSCRPASSSPKTSSRLLFMTALRNLTPAVCNELNCARKAASLSVRDSRVLPWSSWVIVIILSVYVEMCSCPEFYFFGQN
jgi:hypothetical protein